MVHDLFLTALDICEYPEEEKRRVIEALDDYISSGLIEIFLEYIPEDKRDTLIEKANSGAKREELSQFVKEYMRESDEKELQEKIRKLTEGAFEFFYEELYKGSTDGQKDELDKLVNTEK